MLEAVCVNTAKFYVLSDPLLSQAPIFLVANFYYRLCSQPSIARCPYKSYSYYHEKILTIFQGLRAEYGSEDQNLSTIIISVNINICIICLSIFVLCATSC